MKKLITALLFCIITFPAFAQFDSGYIERNWPAIASDTNRTYQEIVGICDSMFALVGYSDSAALDTTEIEEIDGSPYVLYRRWRNFWASRCDVETGKLHDFMADALTVLNNQNKTTTYVPGNCAGTSPLQSSFTSTPLGWQYIGPKKIYGNTASYQGHGQNLGQVNQIEVNPDDRKEVYIRDAWGGMWKTTNAHLAPNNTWTSLHDHLPAFSGLGVTQMYVDFSTTPHRLFCLLGTPQANCVPNTTNWNPRIVGLYYSANDGASYSYMNLSSVLPDLNADPILTMKYWPGNASSTSNKYLFIGTQFKIIRVDITNPLTLACTTMVNMQGGLLPGDGDGGRFRGFNDFAFGGTGYTVLYAATKSNIGNAHPNTAALYRIPNSTLCSSCSLTHIPIPGEIDILKGWGTFSGTADFPTKYPGFHAATGWQRFGSGEYIYCTPHATDVYSVETDVAGSYLQNITYKVSFQLTLPPQTEVDIVLKDVSSTRWYFPIDWGTGITPVAGAIAGNFPVGAGFCGSNPSLAVAGHYKNDKNTPESFTVTDFPVTATHYVSRLEFGAYRLSGYPVSGAWSNDIVIDEIKVLQNYDDFVKNLVVNPATPNTLLCTSDREQSRLQVINDSYPTYGISEFAYPTAGLRPENFVLSAVDPDIVYQYRSQSHAVENFAKRDIGSPSTSPDESGNTLGNMHVDTRSMCVLPNAAGTGDTIYVGHDGGISVGKFGGPWINLNGKGLKTSWLYDIGSSEYTGEVGVAATDNWTTKAKLPTYDTFFYVAGGDGGQAKFGKRAATRNLMFAGYSDGSGFDKLAIRSLGLPGAPVSVYPTFAFSVFTPALSKMVTTYAGEYVGTGYAEESSLGNKFDIYSFHHTGTGVPADPYDFSYRKLTSDASFSVRTKIQAIAPDLYNGDYMAVYMSEANWHSGYFAYSSNITSATPTWTVRANTSANNGTNRNMLCMVADPRSTGSSKRLWAGASGYYHIPESSRVFMTVNNGDNWSDMSIGLPKGPVNALVYDEQSRYLFAGTDQGIYAFNVGAGANSATNPWKCYSLNLPNVFVTGLDINRCTGKIYASTYGRGAFEANLPPQYTPGGIYTTDYTDTCGFRFVNADDAWSGERFEFRSIYVASGVKLILDGCTLNMAKDRHIVVAKGGRLIVKNSKITNACGQLWGGIQVKGDPSLPQTPANQGWVMITGNSIIEHAVTGVTNYNPDPASYPYPSGGIVQVTGSTFLNNRMSVAFEEYHNMSGTTLMPNVSHFTLSKFILDANFRYQLNEPVPSKMVQLRGVEGINFRGCSFLEKRYPYNGFVDGIHAINAGFNVVPFCAVTGPAGCTGETRSRFKGLRNGVYTRASAPGLAVGTVTIDRADFDTSTVGVQISVHEGVSVTRCVFRIGRGIVNTFMESSAGLPASCGRNIGVLTQSSKIYRVEGNTFSGVTNSFGVSPWHNIGVLAINSGNYTNRIYRNSFDHLTYGVLGLGDNRTSYPAYSGYGLQVSCNTFNTNTNDIYSGGTYDYEGIGVQQRGPTYYTSASNSFSGSTKNIVNPNYNRPLQYFNHTGTPTLSGNATLHSAVLDACPATIPTPSGSVTAYPSYMTATTSSLDLTSLAGYKAAYYTQRAEYQNAVAEMAETIDRGNTDSVVNFIDTSSDYTAMFSALGNISPYLSATALRKVAEVASQTNYEDVVALLAENPEVIADYNELNDLADIAGMTAQDFTDLWAVACSTLTGRTTLEGAARSAGAAMDETAGMVLMALKSPIDTNVAVTDTTFAGVCLDTNSVYYLNDSNSYYHSIDSVDSWLATIGKTEMQYERLGIKYLKGEYNSIISSFNAIDTQYLDSAGLVAHRYMKTYLEVLLDAHASGRSIYQLSDTDMQLLSLDAYPALDIRASRVFAGNAKTDPISHFPCAAAPPVSKFPRRIKDRTKGNTTVYRVSAYPNPSKGDVRFECITPANNTEGVRLTVMNLLGETVFDYTMPAKSGSYDWNTGALSSGVYIYVASVNNRIVGKGKVVLVK